MEEGKCTIIQSIVDSFSQIRRTSVPPIYDHQYQSKTQLTKTHLNPPLTSIPRPLCADGERRGKQSRAEKKSRKAVQKLGMKPVPGILRVNIRKSKNVSRFL
jgi:hypothetical protein